MSLDDGIVPSTTFVASVPITIPMTARRQDADQRTLLRLLAKGDLEIAADRGYDLDAVLAAADELLTKK